MKVSEPLETDGHTLNNSKSSQSTLSDHCEDVEKSPEGRFERGSHYTGRYLSQGNDRGAGDYEVTSQNSTTKIHMRRPMVANLSSSPRPSHRCVDMSITPEGLQAYLVASGLPGLQMELASLNHLWSASHEPPVTKSSLSELDLSTIMNDAKLRHDLNFIREVVYRPNHVGSRGEEKKVQAKQYWEALAVECAIYIARRQRPVDHLPSPRLEWLLGPSHITNLPWRLPRLFETLRDILKTLVPSLECPTVDQRLDVDLLIQELDKDACDLVGLGEWLGRLLLGSCSPLRDPIASATVQRIQDGLQEDNARTIAAGLEDLFAILETMKLDVVNHQIRYLRFQMIDDSVHFEQKYFLEKIESGMNVSEASEWYDATIAQDEASLPLGTFSRAIVDMVVASGTPEAQKTISLSTFELDLYRLTILQADFRACICQEVCERAFIRILHGIEPGTHASSAAREGLRYRLWNMRDVGSPSDSLMSQPDDVAIEIINEAFKLRGIRGLPGEVIFSNTIAFLRDGWNAESDLYEELESSLWNDLDNMVDQEMELTNNLLALQIFNRYNPEPPFPEPKHTNECLQSIARRISQIAIFHWRVWGPILYHKPRSGASNTTVPIMEGGAAEDGPRIAIAVSSDSGSETVTPDSGSETAASDDSTDTAIAPHHGSQH